MHRTRSDFRSWEDWISKGRSGLDRPLERNTRAVLHDEYVGILLHQTEVVKFHKNDDTEFNSGGWRTMTTKDRMGYASRFEVYSQSGTWYIYHRGRAKRIERILRRKFGLPQDRTEYVDYDYYFDPDGIYSP